MTSNRWIEQILHRAAEVTTRLLATDSVSTARLRELKNRIIELRVGGLSNSIFVAVDTSGLVFATAAPRVADVTLSGKFAEFVAFARARRTAQAAPAGTLRIEGDLATAQLLQQLLDELNIDWEALLANYVGEVPAHQVGRVARAVFAWGAEARDAWREDLVAFLQTERRVVPTAREVESFSRGSLGLIHDVERLALRVARLRERRR